MVCTQLLKRFSQICYFLAKSWVNLAVSHCRMPQTLEKVTSRKINFISNYRDDFMVFMTRFELSSVVNDTIKH